MKRTLAVLLAVLLVAALTACGAPAETGNTPAASAAPATAAPAAPAGDPLVEKYRPDPAKAYNINWLSMQASPVQNDAPLVQHWNKQFNVNMNVVNVANWDALSIQIAAGDVPDTLQVSGNDRFLKLVADGIFAELSDDVLLTYAPDLYQGLEKEFPGYWADNKVDGKPYAFNGINWWQNYRYPIIWNGKWLEAVGIQNMPSTMDEATAALRAFTNDDPDKNGKKDTFGLSLTGMQLVYSGFGRIVPNAGLFWYEEGGKVVPSLIQPEVKEALAYLANLYKEGVVHPEFVTGENQGGYWALTHQFINGQIGLTCMASHYHWGPGDPAQDYGSAGAIWKAIYDVDKDMALKLGFGDPVANPKGEKLFQAEGGKYQFSYQGVSKKAADRDPGLVGKILQMWNYCMATDADTLSTAIYGFKGEQWDYIELYGEKVPARFPDRTPTNDIEFGGNTLMFGVPLRATYSAAYPGNFIVGDKFGFTNGVKQSAVTMPILAQNEYIAELDKLHQETFFAIIRGEKPVDAFDAFVTEWLAGGGQAIIDEAQQVYAKYK